MQLKKTIAANTDSKKTVHIPPGNSNEIVVRFKGRRYTGHKVVIMGGSTVVCSTKPLRNGAKAYLETYAEVLIMEDSSSSPFSTDVLD